MDPLAIFILELVRTFAFFAATGCTAFGALYLVAPEAAHKVSLVINRSVLTLDTALGKQPRLIGGILLLIGLPLLYIALFLF
ncbi:MAG: hypothetical protein ACE5MG_01475 [Candidatus Methylomirabilales bacterium]